MRRGASWLCTHLLILGCCYETTVVAASGAETGLSPWPACRGTAPHLSSLPSSVAEEGGVQRLEIPAASSGCSLSFAAQEASGNDAPAVQRLASTVLIAGVYDGSFGRPPAVQLHTAAASAAGSVPMLLMTQGGTLILQDLLLTNVTLQNPKQNPSQALLPTDLKLPASATLRLVDVKMIVRKSQLQDYIVHVMSYPDIVHWTDGVSFLHIRSYSSSLVNGKAGLVEGSTITLLSPEGARLNGTPLTILQSLRGDRQVSGVDPATVAAAQGDAAGIVTVTDSYVLGATNSTLVRLIQRLASQDESKAPLLLFIASNVTFSPAGKDPEWPLGGVKIKRPTIWVGSSWRNTSLDFHMEVGQFVLEGPSANVTLVNLVLENLGYGDEVSARDAEGKSLSRSHILWSFRYRRSQPRTVLYDCIMVLPEQIQVDNAAYWTDAFNSQLDFWKKQTAFMRDVLGIQLQKYKRGKLPGDYIFDIIKKDQLMFNVTYTTRPYVAARLKLNFNPILHSDIVTYRADPGVGPVYTREDVAVTLYNVRRSGCQRMYILLPIAPTGGVVSWGPANLDYDHPHPVQPISYQDSSSSSAPHPLRASQLPTNATMGNSSSAGSSVADVDLTHGLSNTWPSPCGELIKCPVQFRGISSSVQPTTVIDVGFVQGLFRLNDTLSGSPGSQAGAPVLPGQQSAATPAPVRTPILQLESLVFTHLPQGTGFGGVSGGQVDSSTAGGAAAPTAAYVPADEAAGVAGGVGSSLPAEAYTHLLWFVTRDITGGNLISLDNVTLHLPPAEAAQMDTLAHAAIAAAGSSDAAVLSMVFPTVNGPLPVVYRSLWYTDGPSNVSAGDYASLFVGQRLLQQLRAQHDSTESTVSGVDIVSPSAITSMSYSRRLLPTPSGPASAAAPQQAAAPVKVLCVGSLEGLGISGRNVCMVAQDVNVPLPPGYVFLLPSSSSSTSWAPWKTAVVAVAVAGAVLVAAGTLLALRRKSRQREQQHQQAMDKDVCRPGSLRTRSDGRMDVESGTSGKDCRRGLGRRSKSIAAAALSAASGLLAASSANSDMIQKLARTLENAAAGITDTTDSASSVVAAAGAIEMNSKDPDSVQYETALSKGTVAASQQLQNEHSVTVGLGEELGRLAAIHQNLFSSAEDAGGDAGCPLAKDQQAGSAASPGIGGVAAAVQLVPVCHQHGIKAATSLPSPQPSTVQRLSSAITAVSAEMHMRRLGGRSTSQAGGIVAASDVAASSVGAQGDSGPSTKAAAGAADPAKQQHPASSGSQQGSPPVSREGSGSSSGSQPQMQQLQLHEVIGSGTFGVVYHATWQGIPAAVKVMQLPVAMAAGREGASLGLEVVCSRREQMAVMETALGSSLSHPNIVQVYTYHLRPLGQTQKLDDGPAAAPANDGSHASAQAVADEAAAASLMRQSGVHKGSGGSGASAAITGYELQLVMEYCPLGSLLAAIDSCLFMDRFTGRPQYLTVLSLALGVARAMHHMHSEGVLHGDLKAGNVLLKMEVTNAGMPNSAWSGPFNGVNQTREVLVSKVADFGLACRISDQDTHISGVHRGTLSHMSPELLLHGRASRASDVYAMGILLWEMATGDKAFAGVPKAMLGAAVVRDGARPQWPSCINSMSGGGIADVVQPPMAYRVLTEKCWAHEPQNRPTFADIATALESLLQDEQMQVAAIAVAAQQQQQQQQWFTAAMDTTGPAATAAQQQQQYGAAPHKAVEAVKKLLGLGPSSSRPLVSTGPSVPSAQAAAAEAAPAPAGPAATWAKKQLQSVGFGYQAPAAHVAAAPGIVGSSCTSSNKAPCAGNHIAAGPESPNPCIYLQSSSTSNNLNNSFGTLVTADSSSNSATASSSGGASPHSQTHRKAAAAAVAAVLRQPAVHGKGVCLTRHVSTKLFSVQEEAGDEIAADELAAVPEGATAQVAAIRHTAAAMATVAPLLRAQHSTGGGGGGSYSASIGEITPAVCSVVSPFAALKTHPW